jgi:hypothetical protein
MPREEVERFDRLRTAFAVDVRQHRGDQPGPIVVGVPADRFNRVECLPLREFLGVDLVEDLTNGPPERAC